MNQDQTSAALYNMVQGALNDMGLLPTGAFAYRGEARIAHDQKVKLLSHIFEVGGANTVLSIGRQIFRSGVDPTVAVLLKAVSPIDVIKRWQRLEKIYHSSHRLSIQHQEPSEIALNHFSIRGQAPGYLEDLLIAGIVFALLEGIGCSGISVSLENGCLIFDGTEFCLGEVERGQNYAIWIFSWDGLYRQDPCVTLPQCGSLEEKLRSIFLTDPARSWTLDQFCSYLDFSSRTLQRKLKQEHLNLRVLVRELRANSAVDLLTNTDQALTQVAFATGYSDQPHFNREFKRCIGLQPGRYRKVLC